MPDFSNNNSTILLVSLFIALIKGVQPNLSCIVNDFSMPDCANNISTILSVLLFIANNKSVEPK